MHDTLEYFSLDPIHRRYHHRDLTFGMLYAWSENFVLPLSHDEVVHGKRSLLSKMPGDRWQQVRQPARAVRLHVGAAGQEDALHGQRVRPMARMEPRRKPRLEPARICRASRTAGAGARSQPALSRRAGAVGGRHRARGLSLDRRRQRRRQRDRLHAHRADQRPPRDLRVQLLAGGAQPLSRRRARRPASIARFSTPTRPTMAAATSATGAASRRPRFRGTDLRTRSQSRCRR